MNSLKEKKECPAAEIRLLWRHIIMRQNRADRDDEFVEVRVYVGCLGPTLVVANLDIARHKDIVQQAEAQKFHCVEQQFS
ncbi:MAG: hypothetical protein ACLUNW_03495 [Prevotella sp.]